MFPIITVMPVLEAAYTMAPLAVQRGMIRVARARSPFVRRAVLSRSSATLAMGIVGSPVRIL